VTDSAGNYIDCDPVVPGDDPGEFDASETGGGASCSMGTGSRDSGVASLIGGALLGLALLRRRRNAA
jgi:LPXTG-motif cell wall-anchored protein